LPNFKRGFYLVFNDHHSKGIANPPKATTALFKGERKVKVAPSLMQTIMWPSILPTPTKQQETQAST